MGVDELPEDVEPWRGESLVERKRRLDRERRLAEADDGVNEIDEILDLED